MASKNPPSGDAWISQIFQAKVAKNGGLVRRKITSVEKHASEERLLFAVKKRGFHMVRIGDWYVVLCNEGDVKVVA